MTRPRRDRPFWLALAILAGGYVALVAAMLMANAAATTPAHFAAAFADPAVQSALTLSLVSSALSAVLSLWVAVPLAYLLTRVRFPGRVLVELLAEVPLVLPPLAVGLSLLLLTRGLGVGGLAYEVPGVVLAQFAVAAAFATRSLRATFAELPRETEESAWVLGCSRAQAFWRVTLPECRGGVVAAGAFAWARSLGEFGPVLIFAGVTRHKTEVLPTTIYLEMSVGRLESATAVSLLLVGVAVVVLAALRLAGFRGPPAE